MRYTPNELQELDLFEVSEFEHTCVKLISDCHLAKVEGCSDHLVREEDRAEEVFVPLAFLVLTPDLIDVEKVEQLVYRYHHATGRLVINEARL